MPGPGPRDGGYVAPAFLSNGFHGLRLGPIPILADPCKRIIHGVPQRLTVHYQTITWQSAYKNVWTEACCGCQMLAQNVQRGPTRADRPLFQQSLPVTCTATPKGDSGCSPQLRFPSGQR